MSADVNHNLDGDTYASLEATGATYTKGSAQDRAIRGLIARTVAPYLRPTMRGLQLGYAEGVDTSLFAPQVRHLDIVEGNRAFVEAGRADSLPNATFHHALFEALLPTVKNQYDAVFAAYVLEHVREPITLLRLARERLTGTGRAWSFL